MYLTNEGSLPRFGRMFMPGGPMRLLIAMLLLSSSSAFAGGYACLSVDRDTQVVIDFAPGTSTAKQVQFIDPELSKAAQVLATFTADDQVLSTEDSSDGVRFTSIVNENIPHPGKHLGGTRVGLLAKVVLNVQTIAENARIQAVTDGTMYAAQASYVKKDGQVLTQDFDCALFLGEEAPDITPQF